MGPRYSLAVAADEWPELTMAQILDSGILQYPRTELPAFNQTAVAAWRMGDHAAAMWLYWDPDDRAEPFTHEIEVARWQDGRWRPLGDRATAPAPGGLSWRLSEPVEWTATAQSRLISSTLWVVGGIARDADVQAEVRQQEVQRSAHPDVQSGCLLLGVEVPPVASVSVDSIPSRTFAHRSPSSH